VFRRVALLIEDEGKKGVVWWRRREVL